MLFKRIMAYIIDIMLIILVTSGLSNLHFLNPNYEAYYEASEKYMEAYEKALNETDLTFINSEEFRDLSYNLQKVNTSNGIIEIVVYILYFVGFQIWTNGQTLGKKLMKIRIESDASDKLKWYQLLLRTIIIYNIWLAALNLVLINVLSKSLFINVYDVISVISNVVLYGSLLIIILRKDNKGLHDLMAKTKVVNV